MTRPAELTFWVDGVPQPQGSKQAFATKKDGNYTGKTTMIETTKGLPAWRKAVQAEAEAAAANAGWDAQREAIAMNAIFYFPRPKGHFGTGRNAGIIRDAAPIHHLTKPDTDKLLRAIGDALTAAKVLTDDATIVGEHGWKAYADGRPPGARITITRMDEL